MPRYKVYSKKYLGALNNKELHALAIKHQKSTSILEDVLETLQPRKRQTAIEARLFIIPILKRRRFRRIIMRSLAVILAAVSAGIAQGFGRDLWQSYSTSISNFIAQLF